MKIFKIVIIGIAIIIGLIFMARPILYLYSECAVYFHKNAFLAEYEFEDFSQFKGVDIFKRGGDKNNQILIMDVSYFINDTSKVGCYVVTLDRANCQIIKTKWTTKYDIDADTVKLQQLVQEFMKYEIPRLKVDEQGNVFVYLADIETMAFARLVSESKLLKNPNNKWKRIKGNWYK